MRKAIVFMMMGILLFSLALAKPDLSKDKFDKKDKDKLDSIYQNVLPSLEIFGTEYQIGDEGKVWLQILRDYYPVNNATCHLNIYYPNYTKFVDYDLMWHLNDSYGLYYYEIPEIPDTTGVYMTEAECSYEHEIFEQSSMMDSFVNASDPDANYGSELVIQVGSVTGTVGEYEGFVRCNTTEFAGSNKTVTEGLFALWNAFNLAKPINVTLYPCAEYWNETNITYNNQPNITGLFGNVTIQVQNVGWYVWNVTEWAQAVSHGTFDCQGYKFNSTTNDTITWFISRDFTDQTTYHPKMLVTFVTNETIHEIRGAGELHVSDYVQDLTNLLFSSLGTEEFESNHDYCLDNETLIKVLTYDQCIGDYCFQNQRNQTVPCPNGCYEETSGDAQCIPSAFNIVIIILLVIVGAIILVSFTLLKGYW